MLNSSFNHNSALQNQINISWKIGPITIPNRLIQGPLAGYSCAPFRAMYRHGALPGYCVSEMISSQELIQKPLKEQRRYIARSPLEGRLAYQISGKHPSILAKAAGLLEDECQAEIIDINMGCPKTKIRKRGAGSALLEDPNLVANIVSTVRKSTAAALTIKIRIQNPTADLELAKIIEDHGADAVIVHGRRWQDDYDIACNTEAIARIKSHLSIPVIANGDIKNAESLSRILKETKADGFMISRAGTGKPLMYQALLKEQEYPTTLSQQRQWFLEHLDGLARLESEFKAVLQSKSLFKYYFRECYHSEHLLPFYQLTSMNEIAKFLSDFVQKVDFNCPE